MAEAPDVALVGPSRPFRGGIADHTIELSARLHRAGRLTEHAGWGRQFPSRVARRATPSEEDIGAPSAPDGPTVIRDLHWDRPATWTRTGSRLRYGASRLVMVVTSPLQLPAVHAVARAFRGGTRGTAHHVTLIVHNVLPHERFPADRPLMRWTLAAADRVVVHSASQAQLARTFFAGEVRVAPLPLHAPTGLGPSPHPAGDRRLGVLGFVGHVRPYKGLDLLIEALGRTRSRPRLVVRGEFWEPVERYQRLAIRYGVDDLVDLRPGYVEPEEFAAVLAGIDALVLPYRTASASQQPRIAFLRGVPVITTDVGDLAEQVRDGIDGLIVGEASAEALARTIDVFSADDRWRRLRAAIRQPDVDAEWAAYLASVVDP